MKNMLFRILSVFLVLLFLGLRAAIVFAKGISAVMVSGPGIQGELTLDDPGDMQSLMQAGFMDQTGYLARPALQLGTPYTITVILNMGETSTPFIRMDYYPTAEGQAGYVHYTGRYNDTGLVDVDEWALMALPADTLFRKLMSSRGIEIQSALASDALPAAVPADGVLAREPRPLARHAQEGVHALDRLAPAPPVRLVEAVV